MTRDRHERERALRRKASERILDEGGVGAPSPVERAAARRLAEHLDGSPLHGNPLPRRLRNFRPAIDTYVASQGGPLPYMLRLREIEAETVGHLQRLREAWTALAAVCEGDDAEFARRWRHTAETWNFAAVNDLISRHNRWFPVEARLPMDPRTGDFATVAGRPYRRRPLDAAWVLERFPPRVRAAA